MLKKKFIFKWLISSFLIFIVFFMIGFFKKPIEIASAQNLELGKQVFFTNCNVCHQNGSNLIIPEKNLQKQTLELNGLLNLNSVIYEITNGKNGMPGFINRLSENEIKEVANYLLEKEDP